MDPSDFVPRELYAEMVAQRDLYLTWVQVLVGAVVSVSVAAYVYVRANASALQRRLDSAYQSIEALKRVRP